MVARVEAGGGRQARGARGIQGDKERARKSCIIGQGRGGRGGKEKVQLLALWQ
jgi:hypothetical protein